MTSCARSAVTRGALAFFRGLNRANVFAIAYRLQTAKRPETRQRRLEQLVGDDGRGQNPLTAGAPRGSRNTSR